MKTKHLTKYLIAAAIFAASGAVFAQEYVDPAANFVSTKSRAEVMDELKMARQDGSYAAASREYTDPAEHFVSTKSRAQVMEERRLAREDGSYLGVETWPGQAEMLARMRHPMQKAPELAGEAKSRASGS